MSISNTLKFILRKGFSSIQNLIFNDTLSEISRPNERPIEYSFVFRHLERNSVENVLDVGSGKSALPALIKDSGIRVTAIDNVRNYWKNGFYNRHYPIQNDDITKTSMTETFDLITCISTLEHIDDADAAVLNMISLLQDGGYLILTFPYNENDEVINAYDLEGSAYGKENPFKTRIFSRKQLDGWFKSSPMEIIIQQYWRCWSGKYWTLGEQILPPQMTSRDAEHQLTCILLRK